MYKVKDQLTIGVCIGNNNAFDNLKNYNQAQKKFPHSLESQARKQATTKYLNRFQKYRKNNATVIL